MATFRSLWFWETAKRHCLNIKPRLKQLYNENRWSDAVTVFSCCFFVEVPTAERAAELCLCTEAGVALGSGLCIMRACVPAVCKWFSLWGSTLQIIVNYCPVNIGLKCPSLIIGEATHKNDSKVEFKIK